ncbi:MAG: hypothetical protein K8R48_07075 [Alphaproteobacteria bacterium]|nr:hypothetical protein [Alphaproteobacteria bacterium]
MSRILFTLSLLFLFSTSAHALEPSVFCTQDAKLCPDGSGIGRTGPNCEFAPCPGEKEEGSIPVCSKELKICPDGSSVGRVGPECEFALCPGETTPGEPASNDPSYEEE